MSHSFFIKQVIREQPSIIIRKKSNPLPLPLLSSSFLRGGPAVKRNIIDCLQLSPTYLPNVPISVLPQAPSRSLSSDTVDRSPRT